MRGPKGKACYIRCRPLTPVTIAMASQLTIATRASPLALAQTQDVCRRLCQAHPALSDEGAIRILPVRTTGDLIQDRTLIEAGGKGLFTLEIEDALREGRADLAVHSAKDVTTRLPAGLDLVAFLPREDPRDALILAAGVCAGEVVGLGMLPTGAIVGTSSLRRQAQILHARPDLTVMPLRGNVGTRLGKLMHGVMDATILAIAGLNRLGMASHPHHLLSVEDMLPAVGQGAIALEIRSDDQRVRDLLAAINCPATYRQVTAERAFLDVLDGSCRTPIAALANLDTSGNLCLHGLVAAPMGTFCERISVVGPAADAQRVGREAGQRLKALLPNGLPLVVSL